ncbi:S-adenosyl-L-methionine-dependent methyltransferase [Tricharina praecox]|uniref:S-adenosyl-L-methionine-dependent methyltransferase n=1 Tax=Tricharina praecox TaxID=43433 RepID=UPI00221FABF9|nr:S-adenosyl-L-methionine-dependent methyltransferase [Tricharina praecox]KAI5858849.1 S-adenosyl-L-methionine-dependent methyltransferase [Tricharina praecox]
MNRNKKKGGNGDRNKFGNRKRERGTGPAKGERGNYTSITTENALFERFYKESNVVPEDEWEDFWGALKRTLPTTFRFTGSRGHALTTLKALQDIYIPHLKGIEWDGQLVDPPRPLAFYPDNLAWGMTTGKSVIRRCPPFKKFQNYLVAETTIGNISRQEAVSMIPPLLMNIEPHHVVLDMCAAPGSKTAQLVEMIHNGEEAAVSASSTGTGSAEMTKEGEMGGRATGIVIANDADYKRSHMLIHQTKRLNSPNLIVTNHDATMYPSLLISNPKDEVKQYLKYDRILADVPCSGDGTARKNYNVWKDWNPHGAFNLHAIQVRILVRGLQMLKVGGRLVYSTCSMNPIENEAVIQTAIRRCGGMSKVEIVDVSDQLPNLKRKSGLKGGWRVMDKDQQWYSTYNDILTDDEGKETRVGRITKSMFPSEDGKAEDDPSRIPLERCVRVYPHLQDTGGFFITVLRKKEEIRAIEPEITKQQRLAELQQSTGTSTPVEVSTPVEASEITLKTEIIPVLQQERNTTPSPPPSPGKRKLDSPAPAPTVKKLKAEVDETSAVPETEDASIIILPPAPEVSTEAPRAFNPRTSTGKKGPPPEEPFKFLPFDHEVLQRIYAFYGLSDRFPRTCFMVRNAEALPVRAIYFTSHLAKKILQSNEGRGVKFVHCGVKAFMKQDVQSPEVCPWRIQSEGLNIVAPWIGSERLVHATKRETVHTLLRELFPKVGGQEKAAKENESKGEDTDEVKEGEAKDVAVPEADVTAEVEDMTVAKGSFMTIGEIDEQVSNLGMGCCILKVAKSPGEFDDDMILPLWKSRFSCNLMLPKDDRKAMLLRLFDDTSDIKDSTNKNHHSHRDANVAAKLAKAEEAEGAEEKSEEVDTEMADEEAKDEEMVEA